MVDDPCKYLSYKNDGIVIRDYCYDAVACLDKDNNCPKKKIRHKITPHCWRVG